MANFYNALGGKTIVGTSTGTDFFYAFTKDTIISRPFADSILASLVWSTAIRNADGSAYKINASNIQVSFDVYQGNGGVDWLYGSDAADAIFYNNGTFGDGVGGISGIQQFNLYGGDDVFDFTGHNGGADFAGDLLVYGGTGRDTIIGGAGKDVIEGEDGDDLILGYRGADDIRGGNGNDTLYGDDLGYNGIAGNDILRGFAGNDTLYGGARDDQLGGGDDNDLLYGGQGLDSLLGGGGDDIMYGDDSATGAGHADTMNGEAGDDKAYGGAGNDSIAGGTGNDLLEGDAGNDSIDGGADIDTAVYSGARSDYIVKLNANGSYTVTDQRTGTSDGSDTLRGIEFVQFSDGTFDITTLNTPPTITSNGGGALAELAIEENGTAVTTVTATDPDPQQTLRYSLTGGVDAALFSIDAATGLLRFINAPNFENPLDADRDNVYDVIVKVDDANGGTDTQRLLVTVTDVPDGAAPVITSNGGGATASVAFAENGTAVTTVEATDPDGPSISYRIVGGADAALFALDAATGVLAFRTAPDHEAPADSNRDNIYQLIVEASDGSNTDQQILSISVTNLNDNPPVITSGGGGTAASVSVDENLTAVTTVTASDADGGALTFRIAGGVDAAFFLLDTTTGALTFKAAPDFENPLDADRNNVYQLIVEVSDGSFTDQQTLSISVENVNDNPPVIRSNGGGSTASIVMAENGTAVTMVVADDADGTTPTYRIAGGADAALFLLNATTGALAFKVAPDFEDPDDADRDNVYDVIVEATDGANSDAQALAIRITDVNEVGKTITGTSARDIITPTASTAAFRTTALSDTIFALDGNDVIDGGAGTDRMEGGTGSDTYTVDTFVDDGKSTNDDLVVELAGGGDDRVNASVSYRLPSEVENLTLLGTAALSGIGNALNNQLVGNAAANALSGEAGNDTLLGNDGSDTLDGGIGNDTLVGGLDGDSLIGGDGADTLDGGTGADLMDGGAGDDSYTVDVFSNDGNSANDDDVVELASGGNDIINASISYWLAAEVERLTLTGSAAIDGTGNVLDNLISGNLGANSLFGLDGNDTLNGSTGNDSLYGGNGNDTLNGGSDADYCEGGAGNDTLNGQAGDDTLYGLDGVDTLVGGTQVDRLYGGAGNDSLNGGTEADYLQGGTGRDLLTGGGTADVDVFLFSYGDTAIADGFLDRISDFRPEDQIDLDFVTGPLAPAAYAEGSIATNAFADAFNLAKSLMAPGTVAVFVAGTTDGWCFWDGTGNDGVLDQAVLMNGMNSTTLIDAANII